MSDITKLREKRDELLREMSSLEQIRRGSVSEQYAETVGKDGKTARRTGPYFLYTFKEKKKTVSRRITQKELVTVYQQQIQDFRRFQECVSELTTIGEKISDLFLSGETGVKKTKNSGSKSKSK